MNLKYIWGLIGLGVGATGGYFFAKYQFEKKHEDYIHESVQKGIESYIMAQEYEAASPEPIEEPVSYSSENPDGDTIDYSSFYHKPSPKELIRMTQEHMAENEHPQDSGEDTEYETMEEEDERLDAELQGDKKLHKEPFEIDEDIYAEKNHYDKETLFWYDHDSTLATESGEVIEEPMSIVGTLLDRFDNPGLEAIFVRNPKMATDYCIVQLQEAFSDRVESEPNWAD